MIFKDIFNVISEVLRHKDAIIYVASGIESIYLVLFKAKVKRPERRQKKVDTRYVNFRSSARKLQYGEKREATVFAPQCITSCKNYVKILSKSSFYKRVFVYP